MRSELAQVLLLLVGLAPGVVAAQFGPGPQPPDPDLLDPVADAADSAGLASVLDEVPSSTVIDPSLVTVPAIYVSEITLQGNTILSADEVEGTVAPFRGRRVTIEELHALRQQLSAAYFGRGYVNSGVIIPDQNVSDGVVRLEVVEGSLSEVVIDGNRALRSAYLNRRVTLGVSDPLNIGDLQTNLRLLQEDPLVTSVNAQLMPGSHPGDGRLNVTVTEQSPWQLDLSADNYRSPAVAAGRGTLVLSHNSLTGNGDVLSARFGLTEGVEDRGLTYRLPLTGRGTSVAAYYSSADSEIIEAPFDDLDIRSKVEALGLTLSHPFIRRLDRRLTGRLGIENKNSESTLLSLPFSFSPGEIDGKAEGASVFATVDWMQRGESSVFAARGTINVGINAFDSTDNDGALPDSTFTQFIGQLQYVRNLAWRDSRLIARSTFQLASEPLLAMYKFAVGGRYTARGYRENLFVRDNGVTASLEYQFPLFVDETGRDRYNLSLAPFADWGRSWDKADSLLLKGTETLASVGLGLLWNPIEGLNGEVYWGQDLVDQDGPADTLQDRGWHLGLHYQINF